MIPINNIIVTGYTSIASLILILYLIDNIIIIIQLKALLLLLISVNQVPFSKFIQKISMSRISFVKSNEQGFFLLIVVYWITAVELFKLLNFFTVTF